MQPLSTVSGWKEKRLFVPAFGLFLFTLFLLLFTHSGLAAQITLARDPNTEIDLAGYRIYYKMSTPGPPYQGAGANENDSSINVPLTYLTDEDYPDFRLTGLDDNKTYYFVVTAYDDYGIESDYSNEVSYLGDGDAGGGCFIATAAFGSSEGRREVIAEFGMRNGECGTGNAE